MRNKILVLIAMFANTSTVSSEIDRSFWKTDAEIDQFYGSASVERGAAAQHESLIRVADRISEMNNFTKSENIEYLGRSLRKLARANVYQVKERFDVFDQVQNTLLSIPGHADFYAEPILESYRAYRDPTHPKHSGSINWFPSEAKYGFETLKFLPSAETVRVLGYMLWEDWKLKVGPNSAFNAVPSALAHQAAWTLFDLPLRNKPTEHFERNEIEDYLPAWQDWYKKVKAGEIPFSFVGQPVEYRFQPDGSLIETLIEIPEEERNEVATKVPGEPSQEPTQEPAKEQDTTSSEEPSSWLWIAIAALISGSLIAWIRMRVLRK